MAGASSFSGDPPLRVDPPGSDSGLIATTRQIGEQVAAKWADQVDRDARVPLETVAALRAAGILGALIPSEQGGFGSSLAEVARAVTALGEHCASSGLLLAMHQIQVACILRHGSTEALAFLLERISSEQLLLANANSEVGVGDRRSSTCALEPTDQGFRLEKHASAISYGEAADVVLATARRDSSAAPTDQVLAVCLGPALTLQPAGEWDTLGLRGTCSRPFKITADVAADMVIAGYGDVFVRTSQPVSCILLSSVWLGIAEAAGRKAHAFVRAEARRQVGSTPRSALRLAELSVVLQELRELLAGGIAAFERSKDTDEVQSYGFAARMDNLKVGSSSLLIDVVRRAVEICGLAGYSNQTPYSMGRLIRDAYAAPLMVNNDRVLHATAQALLARKEL